MKLFECGIYGQPIIRYDNKYCVVVNTYKSNLTRYVQFLDIENNHIFKIKTHNII